MTDSCSASDGDVDVIASPGTTIVWYNVNGNWNVDRGRQHSHHDVDNDGTLLTPSRGSFNQDIGADEAESFFDRDYDRRLFAYAVWYLQSVASAPLGRRLRHDFDLDGTYGDVRSDTVNWYNQDIGRLERRIP